MSNDEYTAESIASDESNKVATKFKYQVWEDRGVFKVYSRNGSYLGSYDSIPEAIEAIDDHHGPAHIDETDSVDLNDSPFHRGR